MKIIKYKLCMNEDRKDIIIKENETNYCGDNTNSPYGIVKMMNDVFNLNNMSEEFTYAIALDTKSKIKGVFEISHGTVNSSLLSPREIMIRMLLSGASNYIIIHNHPSGDCSPSIEDIKTTNKLVLASDIINIPIIDHIIIGENDKYCSFKERGLLD